MRPLRGSFCSVCGETLVSPLFLEREDSLCGPCQSEHPPFERAAAYGSYEGGLRDLIHLLKFEQVRPAAGVLGRMLAEVIAGLEPSLPKGAISVVPVPLHVRKQVQRGFNQAELAVKAALKQLAPERFKLCSGVLVRRRETESQIGLTRHQRLENLRGAFIVTSPARVAGQNILLVDDVFTTGTTVSECARVLRRAGAAGVWVVTVARTLKMTEASAVQENFPDGETEDSHVVVAQDWH
jgi:ComF family protein